MIGWLLAAGLLAIGGNSDIRGACDLWSARAQEAYAYAAAQPEAGVAKPVQPDNPGVLYAKASTAVRHALGAALDRYRAATPADRAVPQPALPGDPGPLYASGPLYAPGPLYAQASIAVRQALTGALDSYRTAMRAARALPQQAPADPGALYVQASIVVRHAVAEALGGYRAAMRVEPAAPQRGPQSGDPLKPLITEASNRFDLPELWIRAVMRAESNGDAAATSPKGAIGLMQVMPGTYAYLSDRYGLGDDPYAPRNNVLAGSAYLREMYDKYGVAGFIAAYNAGPGRYEDSLCRGCTLPDETKRYVASVRLAIGEVLFGHPESRFYEPIAISSHGALLLGRTGKPMPVAERLALHSLVERAAKRAAGAAAK